MNREQHAESRDRGAENRSQNYNGHRLEVNNDQEQAKRFEDLITGGASTLLTS